MTEPHPIRWWQRPLWLGALAAFVLAVAQCAFVLTVADQGAVLDELSKVADSNGQAISSIEKNQEGIDELVAFVRDLKDRPGSSSQAVEEVLRLLCASSDPARQAACAEIQTSQETP